MTEWTGIRQHPEIRAWSSNPAADEAAARWFKTRDPRWLRELEKAEAEKRRSVHRTSAEGCV